MVGEAWQQAWWLDQEAESSDLHKHEAEIVKKDEAIEHQSPPPVTMPFN